MKRLTVILGIISLAALSLPMLQQGLRFMKVNELNGVVEKDTSHVSGSWWNHGLQDRLETYATDSLSLQPACVRLRNQFEFTFFDKLNARDIYEYKGIFFRLHPINYNETWDFAGLERIQKQVNALAGLQNGKYGKKLPVYVIIAPSKLHYFRDQLPEYNRTNSTQTNYHQYKRLLQQAGIPLIDADAWFLHHKSRQQIPVLSKGGIHWTLYGGALAMDSLLKRINYNQSADFQKVEMEITPGYQLYGEDIDVLKLSNLMYNKVEKALRVVYFPEPVKPKKRLRPVVISDSFFHVIAWTPLEPQIFAPETPFYYYFNTRFVHDGPGQPTDLQIVKQDLDQADCVILIMDIQNLHRFGFGFIEKYLDRKWD